MLQDEVRSVTSRVCKTGKQRRHDEASRFARGTMVCCFPIEDEYTVSSVRMIKNGIIANNANVKFYTRDPFT